MAVPVLPESAPFTSAQRAWLNGFFAGVFNLEGPTPAFGAPFPFVPQKMFTENPASNGHSEGIGAAVPAAIEEEGDFAWHDPILSMDERMKLAEGRPIKLQLMAAMAQLDCGSCGYLCQSYAEVLATGEDVDASKCVPGGKETSRKLKELLAAEKATPAQGATATKGAASVPSAAPAASAPVSVPLSNGAAWNGSGTGKSASLAPLQETVYDRRNPYPATVLEIKTLCQPGSEKDVRFVSLDLKGSGLTYKAGDSVGVYPDNCLELVNAIMSELSATGEEPVVTPEGWVVPARIALNKAYVITEISDETISLLAHSAAVSTEAHDLSELLKEDPEGLLERMDVLDLLRRFPSARPTIREFAPTLAPLKPRLYSIASSPLMYPDEVHLTVGVVRYTLNDCDRLRKGVASTHLTEGLKLGDKVAVFIQPSHGFHPPADSDSPMMMVGPGTGIAPFRAFLQERQAAGAKGKNWLFFGDQRRDYDFLYQEELEAFHQGGPLTRFDTAFSRDGAEKVYVQHRMLENAAAVWEWLQDGGSFYVCGDAQRMARDVDAALHRIIAEQGGMTEADAKAYVGQMTRDKRYQRDVY